MSRNKHTVVILGAGMSGVKTGVDLQRANVDSIILEARDRLGGRLLTNREGLGNYDLGASWFHDALNNPLLDKALELGNVDFYFDDGKEVWVTPDGVLDANMKIAPVVDEIVTYTQMVYDRDPTKSDVSLHTLAAEYIWNKKHLLTDEQIKYAPSASRCYSELWYGSSWDSLSAKYTYADGVGHLGRNAFVKSGYDKVFENELKDYPLDQIYKNSEVKRIQRLDNGEICVTTTDKRQFYCDYLVVTIPQTVLKLDSKEEGGITWEPKLPATITKHLETTNFSSLGKVFFEFEDVFWPKDVDRFTIVSKPDDIIMNSIKTNTPPSSDLPSIGAGHVLTDKPEPWDFPSMFINYYRVAGKSALVALTQAPLSEYFERFPEEAWRLFKPVIAKFSNISEQNIPEPTKILTTPWNHDRFARGSYSGTLVGDDFDGMFAFIKGLPNVRFAGAETIDGPANGCAHGAWFSGEREANYIIERLKSKTKL